MEVSWKGFLALLEVFPCTVLEEMVYLLFFFGILGSGILLVKPLHAFCFQLETRAMDRA